MKPPLPTSLHPPHPHPHPHPQRLLLLPPPTRLPPLLSGMGDDDPPEQEELFAKRVGRNTNHTCLDVWSCARRPLRFPDALRTVDEVCPLPYRGPTTAAFDAAAVLEAGPPFKSPFFEPLNDTLLRDHVLCYGAPLKPVVKSSSPCPFALWLPLRMSAHLIEQWVLWYTSMGVCRFYLYDNDPGGGPYAHMFRCNPNVHVILWPTEAGKRTQFATNDHFFAHYKGLHTYGAQLDSDEFLSMRRERNIVEFMKQWIKRYPNAGSIDVQWRMAATTGNDCWAEDVPIAVRFRTGEAKYWAESKPLHLLSRVRFMHHPHYARLKTPYHAYGLDGKPHLRRNWEKSPYTENDVHDAEILHVMQTIEERTLRRVFAPNRGRPDYAPSEDDIAAEKPFVRNISSGIKVIQPV